MVPPLSSAVGSLTQTFVLRPHNTSFLSHCRRHAFVLYVHTVYMSFAAHFHLSDDLAHRENGK